MFKEIGSAVMRVLFGETIPVSKKKFKKKININNIHIQKLEEVNEDLEETEDELTVDGMKLKIQLDLLQHKHYTNNGPDMNIK